MSREIVDQLRAARPGYHPGWGPREFTNWRDEQLAAKQTCFLGDWSFLWDVEISGPQALDVFRDSCINSFERFDVGQAKHIVQCTPEGKVINDGVLLKLAEDRYLTTGATGLHSAWLAATQGYDVQWRQLRRFKYQVSGPAALAVCEEAAGESLDDIRFMRFRTVSIAGADVWALRMGMAGEAGFELHGDGEASADVMARLMEVGQPHGIRQIGSRTIMINHLEAAFPTGNWHFPKEAYHPAVAESGPWIRDHFDTYGLVSALGGSFDSDDIADYTQTPVTLGWARSISFDHEFTGRAALEHEVAHPSRSRVTLVWNEEDVVDIYASLFGDQEPYDQLELPHGERWIFWADRVENSEGSLIGISTPPGYSAYFRRFLTLAYVDIDQATIGSEVTIVWGAPGHRQKRVRATIASAPYKTDRRREGVSVATVAASV